jgi:hypothetical protein
VSPACPALASLFVAHSCPKRPLQHRTIYTCALGIATSAVCKGQPGNTNSISTNLLSLWHLERMYIEGRHRVRGTVRYYWNATAIVISLSPTSSPECELNADNMSFFQKQYNDQDHYAASVNTLIRSCLRIHVIHPANSKGVARYILNVIYTNGNRPLYVYRFLVFARLPAHS